MKCIYFMPILALATINAYASDSTPMQADLTLKLPTCTLGVTPVNDTIVGTYTLEKAQLDANTSGTYAFSKTTSPSRVSTPESCATVPAFKFSFSAPAGGRSGKYATYTAAHGVNWFLQPYIQDITGYTGAGGTGSETRLSGKVAYKSSGAVSSTGTWGPGQATGFVTDGNPANVDYTPTMQPEVEGLTGTYTIWSKAGFAGSVLSATSGYAGVNTYTPTILDGTGSVDIALGLLYDGNGPKVAGITDQGAVVNGLDYGYIGKLIVTAI